MTIKQQVNHGAIQKVCLLHNDIFHPIDLCHTLCQFYAFTSPVLLTIKTNYGMREKKIFCIYGCIRVSRYINVGRKSNL